MSLMKGYFRTRRLATNEQNFLVGRFPKLYMYTTRSRTRAFLSAGDKYCALMPAIIFVRHALGILKFVGTPDSTLVVMEHRLISDTSLPSCTEGEAMDRAGVDGLIDKEVEGPAPQDPSEVGDVKRGLWGNCSGGVIGCSVTCKVHNY